MMGAATTAPGWLASAADALQVVLADGAPDWPALDGALAAEGPDAPTARLLQGMALAAGERRLLALLAAASLDGAAARALVLSAGPGGLPAWAALARIADLTPAQLASSGTLARLALVDGVGEGLDARLALPAALADRLAGGTGLDPLVAAHLLPMPPLPSLADAALLDALAKALRRSGNGLPPALLCDGQDPRVLATALAGLGLACWLLPARSLPDTAEARAQLARRLSRDAALAGAAVVIDGEGADPIRLAGLADRLLGHVLIIASNVRLLRGTRMLDTPAPDTAARWAQGLGPQRTARLGRGLDRLARQFRLDGATIEALVDRFGADCDVAADGGADLLWHEAARLPPPALVTGARLVEPLAKWADLVLPPAITSQLQRLEAQLRHAGTVMDEWGFGHGPRGRGIAALFAGPSGTGKTMAAEVLAGAMDLMLLEVDLSQIISKYVGETSKNIAAAFQLAERTGAVMLWNEGDALWGARGAVGHASDRHINAEVGDLLQRIEAFAGITIVTTNLKHAIDPAFLRRFRAVIDFPLPGNAERLRLWQQAFPPRAPLAEVDFAVLAGQPLTGAAIRNIALGAAVQAAARGQAIDRTLITAELAEELRKSAQSAPRLEWGGSA